MKSNNNCIEQLLFVINKKFMLKKNNSQKATRQVNEQNKILTSALQKATQENLKTNISLNRTVNILILTILIPLAEGFYIIKLHHQNLV